MGSCALSVLLVLTVITVSSAQTQYFDILQGLQQLFQPYQGNDYVNQFSPPTRPPTHRQTNRQDSRKKTEHRHQSERRTKRPLPTNQYDYVFATTEKPTRKTTKTVSSHNNNNSRNINNKNENSNILLGDYYPYDVTTKSNKIKTTTESYSNNHNNRATTQNVFSNNFNAARPVTENVFGNVNHRETFANQAPPLNNGVRLDNSNNYPGNTNSRPQNVNDRSIGNNGATWNTNANNQSPSIQRPNNNRNNAVLNTDNNPGNTFGSSGVNDRRTTTINNNNRGNSNSNSNRDNNNRGPTNFNNNRGISNSNNNRGSSNNNNRGTSNNFNTNNNRGTTSNFNTNNNRGTSNNFNANNNWDKVNNFDVGNTSPGSFYYPDNPLINRPGVQPAPVDIGLPPITNRPVTGNNFFVFNRPSEPSPVTFNNQADREPDILIGPDEDDMTEWQKKRYEDTAERMCDYYKSLTIKKVVALPLIPSPEPVEVNVSDCTPINVPLVIGGTVANIQEFPHMALVGWTKVRNAGYSWKCGGSLISDRYILSAGHCTYQDKDANVVSGPPQAVQLGSSYLDDPGALVVKISAVIRHPKYKQRRSYHDIALIKMVTKVRFSEVIRPACLGVPPPTGRSIIATGWGRTEFGGDHSLQLRSVSLNVWDMEECREIWGTSLKLPNGVTSDSHMCAGERGGGKDTCQGDSGGPAQIQDGCLWRVVAVTSYGRSCGAPDTPALYAVIPHAFVAAQVFSERS